MAASTRTAEPRTRQPTRWAPHQSAHRESALSLHRVSALTDTHAAASCFPCVCPHTVTVPPPFGAGAAGRGRASAQLSTQRTAGGARGAPLNRNGPLLRAALPRRAHRRQEDGARRAAWRGHHDGRVGGMLPLVTMWAQGRCSAQLPKQRSWAGRLTGLQQQRRWAQGSCRSKAHVRATPRSRGEIELCVYLPATPAWAARRCAISCMPLPRGASTLPSPLCALSAPGALSELNVGVGRPCECVVCGSPSLLLKCPRVR